ncbi:ATP-dependent helicase HepA [Bisgaardia hudsonensis]|uniref:RNA polymerase-associated protein RapA n=1 Tax=Bisgaardia hudsonensis TaxID=109472 RepID=A0A4R2MSG1_9PAST|nr:RNA polymerase-associated protein RapA [Bisgaardia hudsonensis]QLB13668.1 RNA polymerase-binding ATPase [Bisgaardia hudsonensis]TCP12001.1 ATP-dependent helicase HepA [Bisgaardia hudsonensis]
MLFAIGQRWISESEGNLGLGMITAVDNRTVTIAFPASDETRIYALENAPLVRVLFQKNTEITAEAGWKGKVIEIMERNNVAFYLVQCLDNDEELILPETEISHQIAFSKPQERLFNAQIDRSDRFVLRYQSFKHQQAQFRSHLRGLRGIRAGLIPHQLHIANEVGHRIAPRVLLADEVGLGKTIEAGMILQQQIFSEKVQRALIIVPETLQHQWLVEMLRRFNLHFSLFDEERCGDFDADEDNVATNPFLSENLIICSLDLLVAQPNRAKQILTGEFDLLIVDEAHHLEWSPDNPSIQYQLVAQLTRAIPAVLLLTATPEQLGQASHFARLSLLDPNRFYDYDAFIAEQKNYQAVADIVKRLLSENELSQQEQDHLSELLSDQEISSLIQRVNSELDISQRKQVRQQLIDNLIDRHGTSRLLFRNTRQSVQGFPKRFYHQINLVMPKQYTNVINLLTTVDNKADLNLFYPEKILQELNPDASWWEFDPRIEWLIDFLKDNRDEKVLVICQYAKSAVELERVLREKEGIRSAVFHENMSIIERDRASAYFSDEEGAQVLLSSSIGSEGRNFQFACHLVLFNLPDNPDLLEQCIGRLDRIGQTRDIHIHIPCFKDTPQILLARWYHEGLNAFEETCPMGATLFEKCGQKLQYFLKNTTALDEFEDFIQDTRQQQIQLKAELEQGRDLLLELNSSGGSQAKQIAMDIAQEDSHTDLVNFTLSLFDVIGVEQEDLNEKSILITPSSTMLIPDFPGLKDEGVTVTFDRDLALVREEFEFLTWDHPIVCNGIDLITSGDIGKCAVSLLVNDKLPVGTLLVELVYIVETQAPKGLHLSRFLPPTPVRLLLDGKGNDLNNAVPFTTLQKKLKPMKKNMANKVVKMLRESIEGLLQLSETKIVDLAQQIIDEAQQQADQTLTADLNRLIALQKVNKNIRQDEIDTLANLREATLDQLQKASWHLDSLHVIVSSKG